MGTKNNPGHFDCYTKAHPDEPMFVLLGRDELGSALVNLWATAKESLEGKTDKVIEARHCAYQMMIWCRLKTPKVPITLEGSFLSLIPFEVLAYELRRRGATVIPAPHGGNFNRSSEEQEENEDDGS